VAINTTVPASADSRTNGNPESCGHHFGIPNCFATGNNPSTETIFTPREFANCVINSKQLADNQ
jgi:hypothetical protein